MVSIIYRVVATSLVLLAACRLDAFAQDLDSKVKYNQMRTRWAIDEGKRKIEADRARMQQEREERAKAREEKARTMTAARSSRSPTTSYQSTASTAVATTTPAGGGLQWYTNPKFKFRALFTGVPTTSVSPAGINSFSCSNEDGAIMVGVTEMPMIVTDPALINKSLNGACDGSIKSQNAVETSRYSCSLQGNPGREFTADIPGHGKVKSRIFLVKNRLYQLIVAGIPSFVDKTSSQQFLKSFSFL